MPTTPRKLRTKLVRALANLSLLALSIVATLLLSEIGLRIAGFAPMYVSPERDRFWKYDPLLGWSHQPGQEGVFETPHFRTAVHINERGLRDREHAYGRAGEGARILVLGDSFAWGYGVEAPERFSEHLAQALGVEVINAGVSGYSTDQELLWLQEEGHKYDIDLVVLILVGNDIGDNERQLVSSIYYKPRFKLEDGRLQLMGLPVPRATARDRSIYRLSQRSALAFFLVQRYFELQAAYGNRQAGGSHAQTAAASDKREAGSFDLTLALLDAIREAAASQGAGFMIVATDSWWNAPPGEQYETFMAQVEDHGFIVLDVTIADGFDPDQMIIAGDGHWNAAGHQFVAGKIIDIVEGQKLLGDRLQLGGN